MFDDDVFNDEPVVDDPSDMFDDDEFNDKPEQPVAEDPSEMFDDDEFNDKPEQPVADDPSEMFDDDEFNDEPKTQNNTNSNIISSHSEVASDAVYSGDKSFDDPIFNTDTKSNFGDKSFDDPIFNEPAASSLLDQTDPADAFDDPVFNDPPTSKRKKRIVRAQSNDTADDVFSNNSGFSPNDSPFVDSAELFRQHDRETLAQTGNSHSDNNRRYKVNRVAHLNGEDVDDSKLVLPDDIVSGSQVSDGHDREDEMFTSRSKMHRFYQENTYGKVTRRNIWVDMGKGDVGVYRNRDSGALRLVFRQDLTLKVKANFNLAGTLSSVAEPTRVMINNCHSLNEDGTVEVAKLAFRVKTPELAQQLYQLCQSVSPQRQIKQTEPEQQATERRRKRGLGFESKKPIPNATPTRKPQPKRKLKPKPKPTPKGPISQPKPSGGGRYCPYIVALLACVCVGLVAAAVVFYEYN